MEKSYDELKNYLIKEGLNPKHAEFQVKDMELSDEINYWIKIIREYPDGEWEHSESWYELVEACYLYRKHSKSIYSKNGPFNDLSAKTSKLKKT